MASLTYTSFDDSILHHLSQQSWRRGMVNFFSESIPFSFSSSNEYADLVADMITLFSKHLNQSINIVEYGAGNGIFAKKCVEKLAEKDTRFHYLITENVPSLVSYFETLAVVKESNHIQAKLLDINDFKLDQPFHVGILTYLLDTCPVKILEFQTGDLYEWRVSVLVKEDATVSFVTNNTLVTWNKSEIETFLSQPIPDDQLPLLSRIHECFDISWKRFQCEASDIDATGILEEWFENHAYQENGVFTFSNAWWAIMDSLRHHVSDKFMFVLYDFASNRGNYYQSYLESFGQFGICYFYSVSFFLFKYYCSRNNLQFLSSDFSESDNQIGIITSVKNKVFQEELTQFFNQDEPGKHVYDYTLLIKQADSLDACLSSIRKSKGVLTLDQQSDYVYLFSIALKFFEFECYDQVIYYLDTILADYGVQSLNAVLLKSKALRKEGFLADALALVEAAIELTPHFDLLHLERAYIAKELNKWDILKTSLESYFETVLANPQWHLLDIVKQL